MVPDRELVLTLRNVFTQRPRRSTRAQQLLEGLELFVDPRSHDGDVWTPTRDNRPAALAGAWKLPKLG